MANIKDHLSKNDYDALFCVTDMYAIGAARALLAQGKSIPDDTMVLGFGNFPEADDFSVPISTIQIPIENIIEKSWEWLMHRIENPGTEPRITILGMDIVHRESTRC
jgi:LacI family transcriptional regulator